MTDFTAQAIEALARVERGESLTEIDRQIIGPLLQQTVESGRIPFVKKLDGYLIGSVKRPARRGLEYCRVILMQAPGQVAALDVMSAGQREPPGRTDQLASDMALDRDAEGYRNVGLSTGYHEMLDREAIRQIEARMSALREIDSLAAAEELDEIMTLLDTSTFNGKSRSFTAENEKARQAVSQSIRYSIRSLVDYEETREIGLHLKRHIKTGRYCSYDGNIKWKFS